MTTSTAWLIATLLAALLIPALVIAWVIESRTDRIQRLSRSGLSQRAIASREGVTVYRVRKALAA